MESIREYIKKPFSQWPHFETPDVKQSRQYRESYPILLQFREDDRIHGFYRIMLGKTFL